MYRKIIFIYRNYIKKIAKRKLSTKTKNYRISKYYKQFIG